MREVEEETGFRCILGESWRPRSTPARRRRSASATGAWRSSAASFASTTRSTRLAGWTPEAAMSASKLQPRLSSCSEVDVVPGDTCKKKDAASPWVRATGQPRIVNEQRLRLHDVPGRQVLRPRPAGAREHLAVVPAGSEDRRARPERRRQVDAAADHGRPRRALVGRRRTRARRDGRAAPAGAGARSGQGRARQRRGRRPPAARPARPLQRDLCRLRGAGRRLRRAPRRAGEGAGADRPPRPVAARRASSTARWTRSACRRETAT